MSSKPLVSVIMGVYNQLDKKILTDAVNSILSQSMSDFEFIIYDDGSCHEAAKLLEEIATTDERIILIGHEQNYGLAFSLNACIRQARGKYIARMDADDISYPNRFARQIEFLEKHPEYSWCGTGADLFDGNGVWGKRIMPETPEVKDYLKYSPYIHPSVMYRADIFEEHTGYLASENTLRCEDYEIFMRFREAGLRGANIQDALLAYREDEASYGRRTMKHRYNEAVCRFRNFKKLGILWPVGWVYVLRPLAAIIIPRELISRIKRLEAGKQSQKKKLVSNGKRENEFYRAESHFEPVGQIQKYSC